MNLERTLNALLVYILMGVITSAFFVQFVWQEVPCPLCLLQRIGMIGVAFGALLNLRFGISRVFYAISLLSALVGAGVALRQIALHVCPGTSPFGSPVLGLSLYVWSFIVFVCSLTFIAVCLMIRDQRPSKENGFEKGAFWLTAWVVGVNLIATFIQCGIGPCD
jgi:disulfide bond formation protein DsbB